jgi:hypothetical protein
MIVIVLIHHLIGTTEMDLRMIAIGTLWGLDAHHMGMVMQEMELWQTKRAARGESAT